MSTDQGPGPELERYFSVPQVAAMFPGRSQRWINRKMRAGEFGTLLHDQGKWLIPLSGIRQFIRDRQVNPAELGAAAAGKVVNLRKGRQ